MQLEKSPESLGDGDALAVYQDPKFLSTGLQPDFKSLTVVAGGETYTINDNIGADDNRLSVDEIKAAHSPPPSLKEIYEIQQKAGVLADKNHEFTVGDRKYYDIDGDNKLTPEEIGLQLPGGLASQPEVPGTVTDRDVAITRVYCADTFPATFRPDIPSFNFAVQDYPTPGINSNIRIFDNLPPAQPPADPIGDDKLNAKELLNPFISPPLSLSQKYEIQNQAGILAEKTSRFTIPPAPPATAGVEYYDIDGDGKLSAAEIKALNPDAQFADLETIYEHAKTAAPKLDKQGSYTAHIGTHEVNFIDWDGDGKLCNAELKQGKLSNAELKQDVAQNVKDLIGDDTKGTLVNGPKGHLLVLDTDANDVLTVDEICKSQPQYTSHVSLWHTYVDLDQDGSITDVDIKQMCPGMSDLGVWWANVWN